MEDSKHELSLLTLPTEVQNLIFQPLRDQANACGFLPTRYSQDLRKSLKYLEYYGPLLENDPGNIGTVALLNLSSTCSRCRHQFSPLAFQSIVLKTSPKSLDSIQRLASSKIWTHVKRIVFCPTLDRNNASLPVASCLRQLRQILSDLPPNLETLTLDFFNAPFKAQIDQSNPGPGVNWHRMIEMSLWAISRHQVKTGSSFRLDLFNLGSLPINLHTDDLHFFLQQVTDINIGLHWFHATVGSYDLFDFNDHLANVKDRILDHLSNVTSLSLHADDLGPVGYGMDHSAFLPLLRLPTQMKNLQHISLERVFFDDDLIHFLTARSSTLVSLSLINCYSSHTSPDLWTRLFHNLADTGSPCLRTVTIDNIDLYQEISSRARSRGGSAFTVYDHELDNHLQELSDITNTLLHERETTNDVRRTRKLLAYAGTTIVDQLLVYDENTMIEEFKRGEYHTAWNRVVDLLEENGRRDGMLLHTRSPSWQYPTDSAGRLRAYTESDVKRLLGPSPTDTPDR